MSYNYDVINMKKILIVYYSVHQGTKQLAEHLAQGVIESGADVMLRTVQRVCSIYDDPLTSRQATDVPFVNKEDVKACDGLILGSPTRFGNMAAPMKYFIDTLVECWVNHELVGKPAGAFCSTSSIHGGQEATLLTMMVPLMHLGCVIVPLPYSYHYVGHTETGGTPYGPSHWSNHNRNMTLSEEEVELCHQYANHFVDIARRLKR